MIKHTIGVIGCGKQGDKHAAALKALGQDVVVADADQKAADNLAARLGCDARSVADVLAGGSISGVVVATPTFTHFDLISKALRAGKDVLCEKPLARNRAEAESLARIEEDTGRHVMVGFIYRHVPAFERLQELGGGDLLGPLVHAHLRIGGRGDHRAWKHRRGEGGGVLNEMAVHMLDLALWLFGPLRRPAVLAAALLAPERRIGGQTLAADAEDYLVVRAETAMGAPVLLLADMVTPAFVQYLDVQYANASAFASIDHNFPARFVLKEGRAEFAPGPHPLAEGGADLYRRQADAFLAMIQGGEPPGRNTIADSIAVAKLVEEIAAQIPEAPAAKSAAR